MSILCSVTSEEKKAEATAMILVLPCATNSVLPSSSKGSWGVLLSNCTVKIG